jgi:serine/threonine-protein kinase
MGRVYKGLHEGLQREVAIKELLTEGTQNGEMVSRFRREALALAAFRHESIVTLYDLVERGSSLHMVMEYVDGPTLSQLLQGGPLPPEAVAVLGSRLASALEHAHSHRILHRDVKPSNVMVSSLGEVKLMDFGIAKDEELVALTQEGIAVGTPSYMSPEMVGGEPLDPRSDLFSLGVVLYECLSGEKPFTGKTAGEVFARIREGKPRRLSRLAPHAPRALVKAVTRAMAREPDRRHFDASDLRRELDAFLVEHVPLSHAGLMMALLRQRRFLTETQAMAQLSPRELSWVERFERPPPSGGAWKRWLWAASAAGATAGLAHWVLG